MNRMLDGIIWKKKVYFIAGLLTSAIAIALSLVKAPTEVVISEIIMATILNGVSYVCASKIIRILRR